MIADPSYFVGRPIESMQTMLRVAAEGNNRLLPVVPDGIFGRNTMAAVTAFQRYCGLPATGVMNQTTWERLVQTYQAQLVQQAPAEAMQPILNPYQTIKAGRATTMSIWSNRFCGSWAPYTGACPKRRSMGPWMRLP